MRSLQFLESSVQSVCAETQLGRGRQGSATYERYYFSASQPKEEIKALEAALAALPDNVDIFGKVRAPLEERLQLARKEARDSKPLDQRLEGCRGALQRASKARQTAIAQQQAAQAALEEAEADETRLRAELAELEKQAPSQTAQPTCIQTISCNAAALSVAVTELSRHMPASEASMIQAALDGLLSLIAQAAEKASRSEAEASSTRVWDCDDKDQHPTTSFSTPSNEAQKAMRRKCFVRSEKQCSDVPTGGPHGYDGKHNRVTPMTVASANIATLDPKAERAAAHARLRQGKRAEDLELMFDDAGVDVIAIQERRLQTTGQR